MSRGSISTMLLLAIPIGIGVLASRKKKNGSGPTVPSSGPKPTVPDPPPSGIKTPDIPEPPQGGQLPDWPPPAPRPLPSGSWLDSLADAYDVKREAQILDAVAAGRFENPIWYNIRSRGAGKYEGYTLQIPVMADALKIEGVRVTGTYPTGQAIADRENWLQFTPYVAGLTFEQADAKLSPTTFSPTLATTSQMIQASAGVDAKLESIKAKRDAEGLVTTLIGNPGKTWVLTRKYWDGSTHPVSGVPSIDAGANHGLFNAPWNPIQNVGVFHPLIRHVDYSQILRFMGPLSLLEAPDGTTKQIDNKFALMGQSNDGESDPDIASMITGVKNKIYGRQVGEGPLPSWRHPRLSLATA